MSIDESSDRFKLERVWFQKISEELKSLADAQELIRRDISDLKAGFSKFEGRQEGNKENQDGLVKRVEKLEMFVDDLRMFKVKVAAYGSLGGVFFGSIAGIVTNVLFKK